MGKLLALNMSVYRESPALQEKEPVSLLVKLRAGEAQYEYSEIYKTHKENLARERELELRREVRPPKINEQSKRIVNSMEVLYIYK